ncbi:AbrB family transcriptional regulator [Staphylococcus agnetis]|uniref:AbrB/MazE/SpoVT family DNA-binding domain-containing protein n=1 Tax=Staphylococcus agnetis TaxID=985762 RepID=UPI00208ECA14|nr:AbrB family transcriptional regulator [Staphylococcus agnetis]MCO4356035.1 AbrB family transcriptional regulator [Staphylococcus agnetis]MCO4365810.1 AbrB family transcriptional regulator [Staphylococcus agnetis]
MEALSKVIKNGNSQAISLNKYILNEAGLNVGDSLRVEISEGAVKFTKKEKSIIDEIHDFYRNGGYYDEKEIDFGDEVGQEIW